MKKNFIRMTTVLILAVLFNNAPVFASSVTSTSTNNDAIENFDESEIYDSFKEMDGLTNYLAENDVTYAEVERFDNSLVKNVSNSAAIAMNSSSSEDDPLLIGAFWYGCLFSALGILVVAVVSGNDYNKVRNSVYGCIVSTTVIAISYIIIEFIYISGY